MAVCFTCNANAQLGGRDSKGMTYGERDMQRTADNTAKGNTPLTKFTIDKKAVDAWLNAQKEARNYKRSLTPQEQAIIDKNKAEMAAYKKSIEKLHAQDAKVAYKYYEQFKKAGLLDVEQYIDPVEDIMSNSGGNPYSEYYERPAYIFMEKMMEAKISFDTLNKNKGSFNSLIQQIEIYTPMFQTALKDLDILEKKFPTFVSAIDTVRLSALSYAFGRKFLNMVYRGEGEKGTNYVNYISKQEQMLRDNIDLFEKLLPKYPEYALQTSVDCWVPNPNGSINKHPLLLLAKKYDNRYEPQQVNFELSHKYFLMYLMAPTSCSDNGVGSYQQLKTEDDKAFVKFLKSISIKDLEKIAKVHQFKFVNEFDQIFKTSHKIVYSEMMKYVKTLKNTNTSEQYYNFDDPDFNNHYKQLTKADWKNLMDKQGATNIVEFFENRTIDNYNIQTIHFRFNSFIYNLIKISYSDPLVYKILNKFSEEGDGYATNALAIRFLALNPNDIYKKKAGKKNYEVINLLKKASTQGSIWAKVNLIYADKWYIEGYQKAEKQVAIADLKSFIQTASLEELKTLQSVITYMNVYYHNDEELTNFKDFPEFLRQQVTNRLKEFS